MSWYWYIAKPDELMVDCDSSALLQIAIKRLERVRKQLKAERIFVHESHTNDHFHLIIKLQKPLPVFERQVWQLYLMDHIWRSLNNLFRAIERNPAPSLLISPDRWCCSGISKSDFWREPDGICHCQNKHKGTRLSGCKLGLKFRGGRDSARNIWIGNR